MADRPSRQDLVVSPQTSNVRFALTAAGCACAGFGIVWTGLVARTWLRGGAPPGATTELPAAVAALDPPLPSSPGRTADVAAAPEGHSPITVEQTSFDTLPADRASPPPSDQRYANRGRFGSSAPLEAHEEPAFFESGVPANESLPPNDSDPATGRSFGAVESTSANAPEEEPPTSEPPSPSADEAPGEDAEPEFVPSSTAALDARSLVAPVDDADSGQAPESLDDGGGIAADEPPGEESLPEDLGDIPAPPPPPFTPGIRGNPLRQPAPVPSTISTESPPSHPFAASPALTSPPAASPRGAARPSLADAPSASATGGGRAAGFADPSALEHDDGAPVPVAASPTTPPQVRGGNAPLPAGMPFAAAPPIGPPSTAPVASGPFAGSQPPGAAASESVPPTPTGQGRPGAIQLEGVQTPQLAVEKRGPREIQVGKTARFEILVRNVGSAVANDVVLRDSVPFGTALVATTPPATPLPAAGMRADAAGSSGDLVWQLGTLPPGGQARVALDLMPMQEGDVGSVASVSFRADASVRARATRPALQITAEAPVPVLVGLESRLTIGIANPGSGIATGVVLEGLLPEGLTHRAGHELEFDVGSLPPGESRTIDLVLATTGPGVHALRLTARADGQIEVNETVKIAVTAPTLELAMEMPSRRYLQRPATCALSMTNAGTAPAVGVELVAQLPPGMKFIRANNAGYYEERNHRVLWNLEELPAAETGQVEVVVMPIALGPQKIVAAARTTAGLSDQIAHTVEVEGLAALAFEVADSEDPIEVGGVSEYVVRVANQGTKPASGVRVVATLLGDMEPVEARGPSPHRVDNLTISFEPLAKLAPSEEATYRIRVRGRREGDQRVQVQLTSDEQPAPITKEEITRVYADR